MGKIINYEERQNKIEYHNSKFIMRKLKNVSFLDYETKTVPNIYTYEEFNLDIEDLIGRMIWFIFFFISILS